MMSGNYLTQALVFLITTAFDIYLLAVVLRFLLQLFRADFYNPISQFLVKITNPPLRYIRRVIPGYKGQDWSSIVLMLLIKMIEISVVYMLTAGSLLAIDSLVVLSVAGILKLIVNVFMIAIFIQVILSWINPGAYNPATVILYRLTEPVLAPARKLLPPIGGLDLSPILVIIALQLSIILIITPLTHFGVALST
ncbi:MAG: YggT family protein [Gammaproteobacteria bacterium]|nr:YggT family protein [Gammaproteobacteria bacterium]